MGPRGLPDGSYIYKEPRDLSVQWSVYVGPCGLSGG